MEISYNYDKGSLINYTIHCLPIFDSFHVKRRGEIVWI